MADIENLGLCHWIRKAYKKFKSNTYFDRTNAPVREQIIHFESSPDWCTASDSEECFQKMEKALLSANEDEWNRYQNSIVQKIQAFCYPKELEVKKAPPILYNGQTAYCMCGETTVHDRYASRGTYSGYFMDFVVWISD